MHKLPRLNSLWVGAEFGYVERLCAASALALGHPFTLYSYAPKSVKNVPEGVELRDAREVLSAESLTRYFDSGWIALAANFFRYALLAQSLGYWVDMDLIFLRPLDFTEQYVFGWERPDSINNAVLRIPAQSEMMMELLQADRKNWRPPWFGPRRTLLYYLNRLRNGDCYPHHLPWGTFGPALITYLARKYNVASQAQGIDVFYPISYSDAELLFGTPAIVEEKLTARSRAIHVWHSRLFSSLDASPPAGSYLEKMCRHYCI